MVTDAGIIFKRDFGRGLGNDTSICFACKPDFDRFADGWLPDW